MKTKYNVTRRRDNVEHLSHQSLQATGVLHSCAYLCDLVPPESLGLTVSGRKAGVKLSALFHAFHLVRMGS